MLLSWILVVICSLALCGCSSYFPKLESVAVSQWVAYEKDAFEAVQKNDLAKAKECYQRAINEIAPYSSQRTRLAQSLCEMASTSVAAHDGIGARKLYIEGIQIYDELAKLEDPPAVTVLLQSRDAKVALANVFYSEGDLERSARLFQDVLSISAILDPQQSDGRSSPKLPADLLKQLRLAHFGREAQQLQSQIDGLSIARADNLLGAGMPNKSAEILLSVLKTIPAGDVKEVVSRLCRAVEVCQSKGLDAETKALIGRAIETFNLRADLQLADSVLLYLTLSKYYSARNEHEKAIAVLEGAERKCRMSSDRGQIRMLNLALAQEYVAALRPKLSERLLLKMRESGLALSEDAQIEVALSLAKACLAQKEPDRARGYLQESLGEYRKSQAGKYSLSIVSLVLELTGQYIDLHRQDENPELIRQAIAILARDMNIATERRADLLLAMANRLKVSGALAESEPLYKECIALLQANPESPASTLTAALVALGFAYEKQKKYELASKAAELAEKVCEERNDDKSLPEALFLSAIVSSETGTPAAAIPKLQKAISIRNRLGPRLAANMASLYQSLAVAYSLNRQFKQSEVSYQKAIAFTESAYGPRSEELAKVLDDALFPYVVQKNYVEAMKLTQRALSIGQLVQTTPKSALVLRTKRVARLYVWMHDNKHALDYFRRELALAETLSRSQRISFRGEWQEDIACLKEIGATHEVRQFQELLSSIPVG
jgi:tetratricopeptide (TPR) repeat protein